MSTVKNPLLEWLLAVRLKHWVPVIVLLLLPAWGMWRAYLDADWIAGAIMLVFEGVAAYAAYLFVRGEIIERRLKKMDEDFWKRVNREEP